MEGLIKQQMADQAAAQPTPPAAPPPEMERPPMQEPTADEPESDPDTDPSYAMALKFAMQALYENGAAKGVAKSLRSTQDPVQGLSDTAYNIVAIVDERTENAVPDDLFALLAAKILQEVADIGEAAGIQYKGSDIALALKNMILRYLGEQGVDTSQLQQAMDQVDPAEFDRMAAEVPA